MTESDKHARSCKKFYITKSVVICHRKVPHPCQARLEPTLTNDILRTGSWPYTQEIRYFVNLPFCLLAFLSNFQLSTFYFVNLAFCHLDILCTFCFVNYSFCQLAILSTRHFVNSPFRQLAILSTRHFVNLPFCQLAILSTCR